MLGRFERETSRLDRFVLDVTTDERGSLDRRVALAIGLLLDTAESG